MNHTNTELADNLLTLLGAVGQRCWMRIAELAAVALPLLSPPRGLRIQTVDDSTLTGILLVEHNKVVAGIVIHHPMTRGGAAPVMPPARHPLAARELFTRSHESLDDDDDCRLPGWADDRRRGDGRWPG
jgi:hypothetical protein